MPICFFRLAAITEGFSTRPLLSTSAASDQAYSVDRSGLLLVGGYSVEATPVPIPNTAVKLYRADGTAGVARWESTSLPTLYKWLVRICRTGHFYLS